MPQDAACTKNVSRVWGLPYFPTIHTLLVAELPTTMPRRVCYPTDTERNISVSTSMTSRLVISALVTRPPFSAADPPASPRVDESCESAGRPPADRAGRHPRNSGASDGRLAVYRPLRGPRAAPGQPSVSPVQGGQAGWGQHSQLHLDDGPEGGVDQLQDARGVLLGRSRVPEGDATQRVGDG